MYLKNYIADLFSQAIEQSGSALSSWAFNDDTVNFSKALIEEFPCTLDYVENISDEAELDEKNELSDNMVKKSLNVCLKEIPHDNIISALGSKVICIKFVL